MNNALSKAASKVGGFIVQKSPTILLILGVGGCISATVIAVKETPKAAKLLEERKEELQQEKLDVKEIVKTTWKLYLPVVITGIVSIACIIFSHSLNERRKAALATAYTIAKTAMTEYRDRVKEEFGPEKDMEIRRDVGEKIEEQFGDVLDSQQKQLLGSPKVWIREPCTGQEFYMSENEVRDRIADLNEQILDRDLGATVNDYLDCLDLNHSEIFGDWEWHVYNSGIIKVYFPKHYIKRPDGSPLLEMELRTFPRPPIKYGDL